jgi:multiple sugar transport system permease protein
MYGMYFVLAIGSLCMIYPLLLMLSGSVKSGTDFYSIAPLPRYLFDDRVLWAKYVESKYTLIPDAEEAQDRTVGLWESLIDKPQFTVHELDQADLFRRFRAQGDWPSEWYRLGHMGTGEYALGQNARAFIRAVEDRYHDDIVAYSDGMGIRYSSWSQITPPETPLGRRVYTFPQTPAYSIIDDLKVHSSLADRWVINLDGLFRAIYLRNQWANIDAYNQAHGTRYSNYQQVLLSADPPAPADPQARTDWEQFVRHDLNVIFIRINPGQTIAFRDFLGQHYDSSIQRLNDAWQTHFSNFDQIPLLSRVQGTAQVFLDYAQFITNPSVCPLDALSIDGPRQGFERFIAQSKHIPLAQVTAEPLPITAVDYLDFQGEKGFLRLEFVKRNYLKVFDYILLHGNGIRNTLIFCSLMILATLTINPLAAYALSRYKPPSAYFILLFCMCTMAFPTEVTMIPAFLLLKRFPALELLVALLVSVVVAGLLHKLLARPRAGIKIIAASLFGIITGFYLLPRLLGNHAYVSLLNTFWALILPGAANGFTIFMLKGFFDSLPRELYEAIEIDGGNEWHKFWLITMSLSKPILAVFALAAFTSAYTEFMMALVIIPDPKMWTLMVWLFQLQSEAPPYVVYASIAIAAIPTMLVFLFCQNLIMKGIVVPVEK